MNKLSRRSFFHTLFVLTFFASGMTALAPRAEAAKLRVVTTLPDLARMIEVIGGDEVEVASLLKGSEDPHFVDAVPDFIRQVSRADVVCSIGMELESGWMPKVLAKSGNAKVQPGGPGFCEAGRGVKALDVPQGKVDRSMGDVHPSGNPHFQLSPLAMADAATYVTQVLSQARPDQKAKFEQGLNTFKQGMVSIHKKMSEKLKAGLAGRTLLAMEYHKEFAYFFSAYGVKSFGSIEEKPGVPPSAGRLAQISVDAKKAGVTVALAALHTPDRSLGKFSELSGIPVKKVPVSAMANGQGLQPLEQLQTELIDALLTTSAPAQGAKSK